MIHERAGGSHASASGDSPPRALAFRLDVPNPRRTARARKTAPNQFSPFASLLLRLCRSVRIFEGSACVRVPKISPFLARLSSPVQARELPSLLVSVFLHLSCKPSGIISAFSNVSLLLLRYYTLRIAGDRLQLLYYSAPDCAAVISSIPSLPAIPFFGSFISFFPSKC